MEDCGKGKKVKAQGDGVEDKKKRNQIKPELGSVKFRNILEEDKSCCFPISAQGPDQELELPRLWS